MASDRILLEGIEIPAALGVSAAERRMRRPVTLDLEIERDLTAAGRSDRIGDTLHYGRVFEVVEDVAANREHKLVEALAAGISIPSSRIRSDCNRIRLTADGKIRTCLFSLREHDLLAALRSGEDDAQIEARLRAAVATKERKHHITDGLFVKPERTLSQIGG